MALDKEFFENLTKHIGEVAGDDKPVFVMFDETSNIHLVIISGETDLPMNVIMSTALMILASQHAINAMNHYKEWLLQNAQSNGTVMATPKGTM